MKKSHKSSAILVTWKFTFDNISIISLLQSGFSINKSSAFSSPFLSKRYSHCSTEEGSRTRHELSLSSQAEFC